jgi:hypothetical protein
LKREKFLGLSPSWPVQKAEPHPHGRNPATDSLMSCLRDAEDELMSEGAWHALLREIDAWVLEVFG